MSVEGGEGEKERSLLQKFKGDGLVLKWGEENKKGGEKSLVSPTTTGRVPKNKPRPSKKEHPVRTGSPSYNSSWEHRWVNPLSSLRA